MTKFNGDGSITALAKAIDDWLKKNEENDK